MLIREMRPRAALLCAIVTAIVGLSHPIRFVSAVDRAGAPLWRASDLYARVIQLERLGATTLAAATQSIESAGGEAHSFYPSLLLVPSHLAADQLPFLLVVGIDAPPAVWDFALAASVRHALLVAGAPGDPQRIAAIAATPTINRETARIVIGAHNQYRWILGSPQAVTPFWIARGVIRTAPRAVDGAALFAARLGYGTPRPILSALLAQGLGAAQIEVAATAESPQQALEELWFDPADGWERHFIVVPPLLISEQVMVWAVIAVIGLLVLIAVLRPGKTRRYLRAIRRRGFFLAAVLSATTASLIGANIALRRLAAELPLEVPVEILFVGKYSLALFAAIVSIAALHGRSRRTTTVYAAAAMLLLLILLVGTAFWNVAMVPFFLWALVAATLFSVARRPGLKFLWLCSAAFPLAVAGIWLARTDMYGVLHGLLTPAYHVEVIGAVAVLPLLLMYFRLECIVPRLPLTRTMAQVGLLGFLGAIVLGTVAQSRTGTAPIVVTQITDTAGVRRVSVHADGRGRTMVLPLRVVDSVSDDVLLFCESVPCTNARPTRERTVIKAQVVRRLERFQLTVAITHPTETLSTRVTIEFDQPVQLYESALPTTPVLGATATRFVVHTGPSPPREWLTELVVRPTRAGVPVARIQLEASDPAERIAVQTRAPENPTEWIAIDRNATALERAVVSVRLE